MDATWKTILLVNVDRETLDFKKDTNYVHCSRNDDFRFSLTRFTIFQKNE